MSGPLVVSSVCAVQSWLYLYGELFQYHPVKFGLAAVYMLDEQPHDRMVGMTMR